MLNLLLRVAAGFSIIALPVVHALGLLKIKNFPPGDFSDPDTFALPFFAMLCGGGLLYLAFRELTNAEFTSGHASFWTFMGGAGAVLAYAFYRAATGHIGNAVFLAVVAGFLFLVAKFAFGGVAAIEKEKARKERESRPPSDEAERDKRRASKAKTVLAQGIWAEPEIASRPAKVAKPYYIIGVVLVLAFLGVAAAEELNASKFVDPRYGLRYLVFGLPALIGAFISLRYARVLDNRVARFGKAHIVLDASLVFPGDRLSGRLTIASPRENIAGDRTRFRLICEDRYLLRDQPGVTRSFGEREFRTYRTRKIWETEQFAPVEGEGEITASFDFTVPEDRRGCVPQNLNTGVRWRLEVTAKGGLGGLFLDFFVPVVDWWN